MKKDTEWALMITYARAAGAPSYGAARERCAEIVETSKFDWEYFCHQIDRTQWEKFS